MGDLGAVSTQVTQKQILGFIGPFFFFYDFSNFDLWAFFISKIKDQKFAVGFFFFEVYAGLKKRKRKGQIQVRVCKFVLQGFKLFF